MIIENFAEAHSTILWSVFIVAVIMGAVVNKTNFCTMGAVSDLVNMGDSGRMRSWFLAMTVAIIGALVLEASGLVGLGETRPPYRVGTFAWPEYVVGGIMFGIGMTFASGCGNKCLVRIGGGNIKSIMVLAIIAVIAYYMVNPFPGTDKTLYSVLFYPWTNPLAVSLSTKQDLGSMAAGITGGDAMTLRMIIGAIIVAVALFLIFKSREFRTSFDNILGGLVVGLAVVAAWYITGGFKIGNEEEAYKWVGYVDNWEFLSDGNMEKPRSVGTQSFTFINPMGETLGYGMSGFDYKFLTFGVMALLGVIGGSLLWAVLSRGFRIEWFASFGDFFKHFIGAILMGFGGVLSVGCTIGQAVSGASTLALGSFLTFISIIFGSALTMKMQYYKMVYDDANFTSILITSLVDMRLLPKSMRTLEAI